MLPCGFVLADGSATGAHPRRGVNALENMLPEDVSAELFACFTPVFGVVTGIVEQGVAGPT